MIKIGENEAKVLEWRYKGIPDRELIRELVRRKRLHTECASQVYFDEMINDEHYMEGINYGIANRLVRFIMRAGHVLYEERSDQSGITPARRTIREGSIVILREPGVEVIQDDDDDEAAEMQRMRGA